MTMTKCECPEESDESEGEADVISIVDWSVPQGSTVRDKMEQEIMDNFLTFEESLLEFVWNDFLKGTNRAKARQFLRH